MMTMIEGTSIFEAGATAECLRMLMSEQIPRFRVF